jgi:hypothetical protein
MIWGLSAAMVFYIEGKKGRKTNTVFDLETRLPKRQRGV